MLTKEFPLTTNNTVLKTDLINNEIEFDCTKKNKTNFTFKKLSAVFSISKKKSYGPKNL